MTNTEAINWIINISADIGKAEHRALWHYEQALDEIREMLESAQPEQRWIPVSERPPEEDGNYLVLYFPKYIKPYCDVISFANDLSKINGYDFQDKKGKKGWYYSGEFGIYYEDTDVYAWMPLPIPYKENKIGGEKDD